MSEIIVHGFLDYAISYDDFVEMLKLAQSASKTFSITVGLETKTLEQWQSDPEVIDKAGGKRMKRMNFCITRQRALELGLLVCKCGHSPHNHYNAVEMCSVECAVCGCKDYNETTIRGVEVSDDVAFTNTLLNELMGKCCDECSKHIAQAKAQFIAQTKGLNK